MNSVSVGLHLHRMDHNVQFASLLSSTANRPYLEELEQQVPVGVLQRQAADVFEAVQRHQVREVSRQDLRDDAAVGQIPASSA
jgi:hypothetical protein